MWSRRSVPAAVALATAAALLLSTPAAAAPSPGLGVASGRTPTLLPSLVPDGHATASAINDSGTIVGSAVADTGYWHATVWRDGRIKDLGTLGGLNSQAEDIDDNGQIVGMAQLPDGSAHAVVWIDDKIHDLGLDGIAQASAGGHISVTYSVNGNSPWSGARGAMVAGAPATGFTTRLIDEVPTGVFASAINAQGTVAGSNHLIDYGLPGWNSGQAFIWRDGVARNIGTLGGPSSFAYDINDVGHVIGRSDVEGDGSPAFFYNGTRMRALLAPAGSSPTAQAINNADVMVGTLGRDSQAVIWSGPRAQPRVLPAPAGTSGAQAQDINQKGAIAGFVMYTQPQFREAAVVWR
jgi:probable HAF family extracellular repeat protein